MSANLLTRIACFMNFIDWSFCGYLAVVTLGAALLHALRGMPRFFSVIALPGTIGHELLHFLVGTLRSRSR